MGLRNFPGGTTHCTRRTQAAATADAITHLLHPPRHLQDLQGVADHPHPPGSPPARDQPLLHPILGHETGGGGQAPVPPPPYRIHSAVTPNTTSSEPPHHTRGPRPPPPPSSSSRTGPPPPPPPIRNGHSSSSKSNIEDFESKFDFHPVEDFPPPEEYRNFTKIYPSKSNKPGPGMIRGVPPAPPLAR
ncbi:WAS/WASL-interacting protein family member 2 [Salmo salar]|uniref:WAS/WASL-interacting protein family member 2 n=1 Tax=Salmo salar TaxID=8030 RepID=A0ABM3DUQ6_SALSA|nr:WAS/WASL-interacting protein family member 2-like [Salmo salar]